MAAEQPVLTQDFLQRVKDQLNANPYTDEQLHRAAFFLVAPPLVTAAEIGAADPSNAALLVVANLYAGGVMADYINSGCISVSAIDRFMTKLGEENESSDRGIPSDERVDAPDAAQAEGAQE